MKTLIILSAFLLALSSCSKDLPCPAPDTASVYIPDPGSDSDPVYTPDPTPDPAPDPSTDPGDDNSGDDDPSCSCYSSHTGNTVTLKTAATLKPVR